MAEVDGDQLAALRRLWASFGFVEIIQVIGHHPDDDPDAAPGKPIGGARMADTERMTPEERAQSPCAPYSGGQRSRRGTARQALDDLLLRTLVVGHRRLEAEQRLAERERDVTADGLRALFLVLRATNGPGWEDPGAVYVSDANVPGRGPPGPGRSPVWSNASAAVGVPR